MKMSVKRERGYMCLCKVATNETAPSPMRRNKYIIGSTCFCVMIHATTNLTCPSYSCTVLAQFTNFDFEMLYRVAILSP